MWKCASTNGGLTSRPPASRRSCAGACRPALTALMRPSCTAMEMSLRPSGQLGGGGGEGAGGGGGGGGVGGVWGVGGGFLRAVGGGLRGGRGRCVWARAALRGGGEGGEGGEWGEKGV